MPTSRLSPSLLRAAPAALALSLPMCSLVDLSGLSGASADAGSARAEGGVVEDGERVDAPVSPEAQVGPDAETKDGDESGDVADVATEASVDAGAAEAGVLSYAATVLADGPIAYWRLDDTTWTTAKDFSGYGHDGTYQGGVTLGVQGAIADDPDTAVQFDGSSVGMLANLPSNFEFAGKAAYSVEVWVKPASSPAGMGIVGKSAYARDAGGYSGWYIGYSTGDYLDSLRNDDATGNAAPGPGAFIHVVATYDGTNIAVYVNGQPFATGLSSTSLAATGAPFTAGSAADWGKFNGVLDEIAIYDKVLPPTRIAAHYARGTSP